MRGLALAVLLPFAPTLALAGHGATLIHDWRTLSLSAQGDSDFGGGSEQSDYLPDSKFADFSAGDTLLTTSAQSAIATVTGLMAATLSSTAMTLDAAISGAATIFDETGYNASVYGVARNQVGFSLSQSTTWRLVATLDGSGGISGVADIVLSQGEYPGGAILGSWSSNTLSLVDTEITLGPGSYTMTMEARTTLSIFAQSTESGYAGINASFTLVPAPGATALAALGLALTARRRRA